MSKFQSFATQGSFRDYQLEAPDETAKIEQETERTIRGRERAQRFLEGNRELYLQAQRLVQGVEKNNREQNFKLETQSRRAYKDILDQEYNLQVEANKQQLAVQQQTYKDLSAFSKSAFELYGNIDKEITERQTEANTVNTILAGTTYQENLAIQSIVGNLTEAEFAQHEVIQNLVKEGKDVKALWTLWKNRKTRGFIDNAGVIENTSRAAVPFLQKAMLEQSKNPNLTTVEEKRLDLEKQMRQWMATSFKSADGRQLNAKLINSIGAPIFNRAYTQAMAEFDRLEKKENEENLDQARRDGYNLAWANGGASEVMKLFSDYPGKDTRKYITDWAVDRVEAGTMTAEEAESLVKTLFKGPNNEDTTWEEKFPSDPNIGRLREVRKKQRRDAVNEYTLREAELKIATETKIQQKLDEFIVDGDGYLSDEESAVIKALEEEGPPGYESPAFTEARKHTVKAKEAELIKNHLQQKVDNMTLKVSDVLEIKSNFDLVRAFLPIAELQEKLRSTPTNPANIEAIKTAVANDRRILNAKNETVVLMQQQFVREYNTLLNQTRDPDKAVAAVLTRIENLKKNPGAIVNGAYTQITEKIKTDAAGAKTSLQQYQNFLKAASKPGFRDNPQKALNTIGVENYTKARQAVLQGREVPGIIKQGAALFNVTPLEFINFLSRGKAGEKPITLDAQLEKLRSQIKPSTRRFYIRPTSNRVERGNYINNPNSVKPTRGRFNVVQYVSNDPRFKNRSFGPIVYDPHGHGGKNMHVHYEFATKEEALAAKALFESKGFRISSFIRPNDTRSAHSKGFALDVAPPLSLPYNERAELEWINSVNAVIGYNPQ